MFPPSIIENIGYYVYLYINPVDGKIFYVGKGKGNRLFQHLTDDTEHDKNLLIKEIRKQGEDPIIEILAHGIATEELALKIEAVAIDLLGLSNLTNKVLGWGSNIVGRMEVKRLSALYDKTPGIITEPSILIRINQKFRYGMSQIELYEVTRGVWKIGSRRKNVRLAFAIYKGIIQEVYAVNSWHQAGTLLYQTRTDTDSPDRWEFDGVLASQDIRDKYIDKSVEAYFPPKSRNPITYVHC